MLDGELAVPWTRNPLSGVEFPFEARSLWDWRHEVALKAGTRAAEAREPPQVRKKARVSGPFRAPRSLLAGAGWWR